MYLKELKEILKTEIINIFNYKESYKFKSFFWNSKEKKKSNIFIAIKGEKDNGNFYLSEVIKNSCKCIISEEINTINLYVEKKNIIFILVKNIQNVFNLIGKFGIEKFKGIKITITGSSGKTTSTYILSNILKKYNKVIYSDKYNTQYFLRKLCFDLRKNNSKFFIAELSSDSLGMIENYSKIISPDYSIITSIENAHWKSFNGYENIFKEKTSMIFFTKKYVYIQKKYEKNFLNFPLEEKNKIKFIENKNIWKINKKKLSFKGNHNFENITLILNLLKDLKKNNQKKNLSTLYELNNFPGRGNIFSLSLRDLKLKFILSYHNSNPDSFLKSLQDIKEKTILIIGFMYDLGEIEEEKHKEIINFINENKYIEHIYVYDLNFYKYIIYIKKNILNNFFEIFNCIKEKKITSIFLKGSRTSKLENFFKDFLTFLKI